MTQYSKFNLIYRLQKWMDSVPGQTFLNYAYSWGASIVIAGTLFKLTHLPGANLMLFLGMGTEVVVFFLSAFDRPFDKTADGRELPTHLEETEDGELIAAGAPATATVHGATGSGGTIIIGGGASTGSGEAVATGETTVVGDSPAVGGGIVFGGQPHASDDEAVKPATQQPVVIPPSAWVTNQQETTPEMAEAQSNYVDALNSLTEMLSKVSAQSERLTRDSEEMENLNRTLTGITKIYEMQLKAASQQVGTIDQINEQTRKMAEQIEQLNKIYARMIEAMTVNMRAATPTL